MEETAELVFEPRPFSKGLAAFPMSTSTLRTNRFDIAFQITVLDPDAVFAAAKAALIAGSGIWDEADIEGTIGSSDDPLIEDCLAILFQPRTVNGCSVRSFDIDAARPALLEISAR